MTALRKSTTLALSLATAMVFAPALANACVTPEKDDPKDMVVKHPTVHVVAAPKAQVVVVTHDEILFRTFLAKHPEVDASVINADQREDIIDRMKEDEQKLFEGALAGEKREAEQVARAEKKKVVAPLVVAVVKDGHGKNVEVALAARYGNGIQQNNVQLSGIDAGHVYVGAGAVPVVADSFAKVAGAVGEDAFGIGVLNGALKTSINTAANAAGGKGGSATSNSGSTSVAGAASSSSSNSNANSTSSATQSQGQNQGQGQSQSQGQNQNQGQNQGQNYSKPCEDSTSNVKISRDTQFASAVKTTSFALTV